MSEFRTSLPAEQNNAPLWQSRFYWLTAVLVVVRLFLAVYLDLTPDETYYWELSRQPDWSYFDHPPMVAWLIALFRLLPGESQLYVRLLSVMCSAFVGWCMFVISRDFLANARAGFWAVFIMSLTPAGTALGFITTPDTPLAAAWAFGALAFLKAVNDTRDRWWIALGLALGCGALSKYNMIMFVPGVAVAILAFKRYRHLVFTRRYWLMVLLAAAGTLPIIYWNIQHDWISFKFQFDHGLSANQRSVVKNFGEYFGGQLGTLGLTLFPVLWFVVVRQAFLAYKKQEEVRFFLAWLALPTMLFFTWTGLNSKVEANWPQVAYLSGIILIAEWIVTSGNFRRRLFWVSGPSFALAVLAIIQSLTLILPLPVRSDITLRMHGWRQMGEYLRQADVETGKKAVFVVQGTTLTTLAGYYGGIESARIAELYANGNFRIWWRDRQLEPGSDVVFVDADRYPEASVFATNFTSTASSSHEIFACGKFIRRINITRMYGLREPLRFKPVKVF